MVVKQSKIGQFAKGVFAARNFVKGEVVVKYNLSEISEEEFDALGPAEQMFVHTHYDKLFLYGYPERFVNHSSNPNTVQDFDIGADVALRDIGSGEEITTDAAKDDI